MKRLKYLEVANYPGGGKPRQDNSQPLFIYLPVLLLLALLLAACGNSFTPSSNIGSIDTHNAHSQPNTISSIMATGSFHEYPLPQSNSGLMRPAIDHAGRIWFGEMGYNFLAVFDPHTQKFQQITPPHGRYGIMGVEVASDDTIWFAEQIANYIGHYFPTTGQFQIYPLPTLTAPDPGDISKTLTLPYAPNDLALDKHGNVWFTELNADALGRLDIHRGLFQQFPLSTKKSVQKLNPYGIAVDPQGMVWFTETSTNHVGRLDPTTGQIRYFTMQGPATPLMEIASDAHGIIWITSFSSALLLSLNPNTGRLTPYYAPSTGGIYGIAITPTDQVWVTISADNVIARLDGAANRFIYYAIPTSGSLPLGVVVGANNTLWFTEAGRDKIGMLQP
jgi:virginiamycin B lyase